MALFTGSKSAAALLSKKLMPQTADYLDGIVEAGTMENTELFDMVRWLSEKQLDGILDDIIKEVEGMEEATGLIKNLSRKSVVKKVAGSKQTVTSTLGNEIDITPSFNHSLVNENPEPYGKPNSSIDILDSEGNVITRRWYDLDGKAYRDVDMSDHGNPKEHPKVPHEHTWKYSDGKPKRN